MSINGTNSINNVTVYLPECTAYVSTSSINYDDSIAFQPTEWEYYKVGLFNAGAGFGARFEQP